MDATNGILRAVKDLAPTLGEHPVALWDSAKAGAQRAADVLPEGMGLDHVKDMIRKHPIVATFAVLAIGGLLSAQRLVGQKPA